jgi:type II secretory pathway pseudopilin PulG
MWSSVPNPQRDGGSSLPELIILLGLAAVLVQTVAPGWVRWRQGQRVQGAADELALLVTALRVRSAATGVAHGVLFRAAPPELQWEVLRDGDGDGMRISDVRNGTDVRVAGPFDLGTRYPGVGLGLPTGVVAPAGGVTPEDGVAFGASDLLSVMPSGSTSSGSVYLCGGWGRCSAMRLQGSTGRITAWARLPTDGTWIVR